MEKKITYERYHRQLILKGFGEKGQQALLQSTVLVIGAGGLGCPVLQYLTAAGVRSIGIVDDDVVTVSNLHRQVLYDTTDIGKSKVSAAVARLQSVNPDTELKAYPVRLDKNNCLELIAGYDIIIDCTDNFSSRYMINDACVLKGKPLVYGAVSRYEGQAAVFNVKRNGKNASGNYRDLFPLQPEAGEVMNCAAAGVLGVLPGLIGCIQASEVIKLITGIGEPLVNRLLTYNALDNRTFIFDYDNTISASSMPASEKEFYEMDYKQECVTGDFSITIDTAKFEELLKQENTLVIDVREAHELPVVNEFMHIKIPLSNLEQELDKMNKEQLIFFCQSGIRSREAVAIVAAHFGETRSCYSLAGGIVSWKKAQEKQVI